MKKTAEEAQRGGAAGGIGAEQSVETRRKDFRVAIDSTRFSDKPLLSPWTNISHDATTTSPQFKHF